MMNTEGNLFLQILKAALEGKPAEASQTVTAEQWSHLFELARAHQVLPMILQALHGCPAACCIWRCIRACFRPTAMPTAT